MHNKLPWKQTDRDATTERSTEWVLNLLHSRLILPAVWYGGRRNDVLLLRTQC